MFKNLSLFYQPLAQFASQFDSPHAESIKSVLRLIVISVVSGIITQMLAQLNLVPESQYMKVFVFTFTIPLRSTLFLILTAAGKYVDKLLFEVNSNKRKPAGNVSTGIVPF